MLEAGLVCWWDQTADVLKGEVGFEREAVGVEVLFETTAEEAAVDEEVERDRVGVEHGLGVENTGEAITADVGGDEELALALIELDVLLLGGEGHPDLGAGFGRVVHGGSGGACCCGIICGVCSYCCSVWEVRV